MMDAALRTEKLADDILRGAEQIADYVYGDPGSRRKIYHLAETSRFPIFRLGSVLCARRSKIKEWIDEQERRCWRQERQSSNEAEGVRTGGPPMVQDALASAPLCSEA